MNERIDMLLSIFFFGLGEKVEFVKLLLSERRRSSEEIVLKLRQKPLL